MKILSNEMAQHYQIGSLQRGHLIFTSFISQDGKFLFLESHIERLLKGADFLFPNNDWSFSHEKLKQYVEEEFRKIKLSTNEESYIRLNISEDTVHLQRRAFEVYPDRLKVMTGLKIKTASLIPSYVKLSNYVESDLELVRAKFKNFDDVLFFDNQENITETTTSNVFVVNESGQILTPPPSSMILDGVTRCKLIEKLKDSGLEVLEQSIAKSDLLKSKEIWLTNSVKGLRFVEQFESSNFKKNNSMFEKAVSLFGRYGELYE